MIVREVRFDEKNVYNSKVLHPIQSWQWGNFKEKTGVEIERVGVFDGKKLRSAYQLTFHSIPKLDYRVGYFPKGPMPDKQMLIALQKLGNEKKAIFIKLEPQVKKQDKDSSLQTLERDFYFQKGKDIFTPYTFQVDLTRSEEELLAAMKPKTRYNVRLAQKNGVVVSQDNSKLAFAEYLRLTFETTKRQKFYAHDEKYHKKMWETLSPAGIAHLLKATWKGKTLASWIVFVFNGVLYYPYGASSSEHRNLMASNLVMWEAMLFGKRMNCRLFDLWGCLGPDPDPKDPWYGFHRFKAGFGGELVEFIGAYDLVIYPQLYSLYNIADKLRWKWLRLATRFR